MEQLVSYIDARREEMLAFLEQVVNIDSGTHDKAGVDQVGEAFAKWLSSLGFSVERSLQDRFGDHIVGRKTGTGSRSMLFIGHMDTVFPAGTASRRPFHVEGDRALGPGVLDMKGGDVSLLYALEALKNTGDPAFERMGMTVIFNSDEEVLSPTSRSIIEAEAKRADSACVFEPARPGGEYVIRRKGVGKYYLTVHGKAAHAGAQPEAGRSAIGELAHKIIAIHAITDLANGTTLNVGLARGGERSNVVAESAYAEIDLRAPTVEDATRVDAQLREIASNSTVSGTTAEIKGGLDFPPMEQTPASRALFEAIQDIGRRLGLELRGIATGGGSDGNHTAQFTPTIDGMGPKGSETHSDREFIEVETLFDRTKVTALYLSAWPELIERVASRRG